MFPVIKWNNSIKEKYKNSEQLRAAVVLKKNEGFLIIIFIIINYLN